MSLQIQTQCPDILRHLNILAKLYFREPAFTDNTLKTLTLADVKSCSLAGSSWTHLSPRAVNPSWQQGKVCTSPSVCIFTVLEQVNKHLWSYVDGYERSVITETVWRWGVRACVSSRWCAGLYQRHATPGQAFGNARETFWMDGR